MDINDINEREEIKEGAATRKIEEQTARLPSINWLGLAFGGIVLSSVAEFVFNKKDLGHFFGLWVPSLLVIGVYNKLVKVEANMERSLLH